MIIIVQILSPELQKLCPTVEMKKLILNPQEPKDNDV